MEELSIVVVGLTEPEAVFLGRRLYSSYAKTALGKREAAQYIDQFSKLDHLSDEFGEHCEFCEIVHSQCEGSINRSKLDHLSDQFREHCDNCEL